MISLAEKAMNSCSHEAQTSNSDIKQPFRLLVQGQLFVIDAAVISKLSPVFAKVIVTPDNATGSDHPVKEIVDESSSDISKFLDCCNDFDLINGQLFFCDIY
ncbi:unnamed protein product [Gongylonema pulchrum]|uniref:BTB domain-containing protein n=1 Tax=Gongylonema pulchrum TaxID=637853 RepID=A0A183DK75_9BILA|nr:unnamed protein product [Gongylonema pulchrum]